EGQLRLPRPGVILLLTILVTAAGVSILSTVDALNVYFYDTFSLTVPLMSLAVFQLILNARSIPRFTTLAPLTFGVYLTHPVFLDIAKRTGAYLPTSGTVSQTPLAAIVIFVLSVVFVRVLRQMPGGTRITSINLSCQRPAHGHTLTILPVATLATMRQRRRCQVVRFPRLWVALWILVG